MYKLLFLFIFLIFNDAFATRCSDLLMGQVDSITLDLIPNKQAINILTKDDATIKAFFDEWMDDHYVHDLITTEVLYNHIINPTYGMTNIGPLNGKNIMVPAIKSGGHTALGIIKFLEKRPDIDRPVFGSSSSGPSTLKSRVNSSGQISIYVSLNGVIKITFPKSAMNRNGLQGTMSPAKNGEFVYRSKTLFPGYYNNVDIVASIIYIVSNSEPIGGFNNLIVYEGYGIGGVKISIKVDKKTGKVLTAYPSWHGQNELLGLSKDYLDVYSDNDIDFLFYVYLSSLKMRFTAIRDKYGKRNDEFTSKKEENEEKDLEKLLKEEDIEIKDYPFLRKKFSEATAQKVSLQGFHDARIELNMFYHIYEMVSGRLVPEDYSVFKTFFQMSQQMAKIEAEYLEQNGYSLKIIEKIKLIGEYLLEVRGMVKRGEI